MATNVVQILENLPSAQHGYFTRAQASVADVTDVELIRATNKNFIERVDHGIYRVAGAAYDRFAELRIAWLRLAPEERPRARTLHPTIWVSHESAADVHDCGVFLADTPTFTVMNRIQPRTSRGIRIHRRSKGLNRDEWTVRRGFAVTSINRTAADLKASGIDGGHLGRFLSDAIDRGLAAPQALQDSMGIRPNEFAALIEMSAPPVMAS